MKQYINAKLQIVRADSDIVTASVAIGDPILGQDVNAGAPRRRSIWD